MDRKKPGVNVIADILKAATEARPTSGFLASLYQQYQERGFLTRKQLEGLHAKSLKIESIPTGKLATLEAIIQKMPIRYKSEKPVGASPIYEKSVPVHMIITRILEKQPKHKQVLFLKNKFDNNIPLTATEYSELARFYQLFVGKA